MNKLLKATKTALDKKEYETVLQHCQSVFSKDAANYNGHVFAGLASLQLGLHDDSKRHYKTAIDAQPDNPLAWKGLADFYDKHRPVIQDEQLDALSTYSKLLPFVESDGPKFISTLFKMAALHEVLSQHSEVLSCYRRILATTEGVEIPTDNLITMATYLLGLKDNSQDTWDLLKNAFNLLPEGSTKNERRSKFISRGMAVFKASESLPSGLYDNLVSECEQLLSTHCQLALLSLVQLTLWDYVPGIQIYDPSSILIELPSNQRGWCEQLHGLLDEGTLDASGVGVACAGGALLLMADRKWTAARTLVEKGLAASPGVCELHLLSAMTCLSLHDYHSAESASQRGLKCLTSVPKSLGLIYQRKLKLCLLCAAVGLSDGELAKALANELFQAMSGDCHVTTLVGRGYLTAGDVPKAMEVLDRLKGETSSEGLVTVLEGEICLSSGQWEDAVSGFSSALSLTPTLSSLHFLHGFAVWRSKVEDKKPAYFSFLQAGKLDPHNGKVFYYLGLYQKSINKNTSRAIKCFQKAVDLMPTLTEAAMELGDLLTASGEEEKAFDIYKKICSDVPPNKAQRAWLRTGLHHQSRARYNEAIKCFQTYLRVDKNNVQCWECLGDAYLSRGSPSSALKAFNKCLEFEPSSLYCLYQLAGIQQLLGQLREAVTEYTAVLDVDPSYIPALKGRGETHLSLAKAAIAENLDSNAVDHVSLALQDLTCAAHQRPQFVCLWKLIGDSCSALHPLPGGVARPNVPVILQGQSSSDLRDCVVVSKTELLKIGIRAYAQALRLSPGSAYCWHDLALCYYHLSKESEGDERKTILDTALRTAKKAVSEAPHSHLYWNTLGLIAADPGLEDIGLAQHCFITSLLKTNNATAWSNLGALYFKQGNTKLAHQAFSLAQSANPDQTEAWVGQALVADAIAHSEAMDLFRHSTILGYHPEGALGYGYWVCHTLHTINPALILSPGGRSLNATATTALLQARDTLDKYVRRVESDQCALNYLGLLLEQEGLTSRAVDAYRRALKVRAGQKDEAVRLNLARALCENGSCDEAVSELAHLPQSDPLVRLQLALALHGAEQWTESFKVYQDLLSEEGCVASDDRSAVLTAQAMTAFASGDRATCKSLLFKSFQCSPVSAHGLVAMCVLGCLVNDLTLLQAALQEIIKILDSGTDPFLHPSCITALNTIACTLRTHPEASECVAAIHVVTGRLTVEELHSLPPPNPLTLHTLFSNISTPEEILNVVQKIFHAYPSQEWCAAYLLKYIGQS